MCLSDVYEYKNQSSTTIYYIITTSGLHVSALSQAILRPYKEQIQGYLSVSCTPGSQALTKCGVIIITAYISS